MQKAHKIKRDDYTEITVSIRIDDNQMYSQRVCIDHKMMLGKTTRELRNFIVDMVQNASCGPAQAAARECFGNGLDRAIRRIK